MASSCRPHPGRAARGGQGAGLADAGAGRDRRVRGPPPRRGRGDRLLRRRRGADQRRETLACRPRCGHGARRGRHPAHPGARRRRRAAPGPTGAVWSGWRTGSPSSTAGSGSRARPTAARSSPQTSPSATSSPQALAPGRSPSVREQRRSPRTPPHSRRDPRRTGSDPRRRAPAARDTQFRGCPGAELAQRVVPGAAENAKCTCQPALVSELLLTRIPEARRAREPQASQVRSWSRLSTRNPRTAVWEEGLQAASVRGLELAPVRRYPVDRRRDRARHQPNVRAGWGTT